MKKSRLIHYTLGIMVFLALSLSSVGQQRTLTGIVQNATNGNPLEGATISLENSNVTTITDRNGKFEITLPRTKSTLDVSFVGFVTQSVDVNANQTNLSISLVESAGNQLSDVVIVGYGTQKRSDLTGSISSIKGKDLALLPTQRADQALQGRAAGVMVLNTDGAPGGNTTIRIRGTNSINGGNSALIVIDGLQGGDLNSLNPNDIASVEILKDASATAIYGSQGANGVVLITTKSGVLGKPVISYNYDYGIAKINKKLPLLSASDYAKNINAVRLSQNGNGIDPLPIFSDAEIKAFEKNGGTDWQDVIYRTAITQNHQLSISGATERTNYLVSAGYLDQEGILLNSGYDRFSLRAAVKTEISSWLNFNLNWAGSMQKSNSVQFGNATDWPANPIGAALRFSPTIPVYDSTGDYSRAAKNYGNSTLWNPLASLVEPFIKNNTVKNNLNAYLEFKINKDLTLRINGGAILTNNRNLSFFNTKTFTGLPANGSGEIYTNVSEYYQNSNILTYDKTFNKHHLTVTAVGEQKYSVGNSSTTDGQDFLNQQTGIYDLGGANIITASSSESKRVINSYLGRVNYVFADKYLFTASYRADGSSVFGKNNKWGYFPSAAFAWRASEEDFIKNLDIFSDLKVRTSWGITGNQAIGAFQTLARISSGSNYPYNGSDATDLGLYISSSANPNLKWESTSQVNLGVDFGILSGRLTVTADYYKKTTTNLLMPRELPTYTGFSSIIDNVGSMGNEGVEFSISGDVSGAGRQFRWHSGLNLSSNKTTVIDLGGFPTKTQMIGYRSGGSGQGTNSAFMYLVRGKTFGQMVGYGYEGVWKVSEAKEAAKYGQLPGDPHYTDKNNDGKISSLDTMVIGNSMPKLIFGWNNQFTYKNFDLYILVQGQQGNDIFNVARIALDASTGTSTRLLNRWTPQNENSDIPGIIDQRTRENAGLVNNISFPPSTSNTLSRYVEDGSYLRVKNVTLNYNFSRQTLEKIKVKNLKVYFSVTNLLTLTRYTGFDPEVSSYTGNDAQLGSDYNNYPSSRTFNLGLNVSF